MEKQIKVDFCEEILYLQEKDLPIYQAKVDELREIALRAGYTQNRAEAEYYLKILKDEE